MLRIHNKLLAMRLIRMAKEDIRMRAHFRKSGEWNTKIDFGNTKSLKAIVKKYGWPTTKLVGKKASHTAWLLVQHADHDVLFQKHCLSLMKQAYALNPKSVELRDIAYLTDRVQIHIGKKQIYGTQLRIRKKGGSVLLPVEDRQSLDTRRLMMGLVPFEEYHKYHEANTKKKPRT